MKKQLLQTVASLLISIAAAIAGPPAICHPISIGDARSLPWSDRGGWNGGDPHYDVSHLAADTLALLTPATPLNVRMETIRRAAIYSVRRENLPDQVLVQLLARAANAESAGKPDAMAWFDAGYYVEAMRQMAFVQRYSMISPEEKAMWKWRSESRLLDGKPLDGRPWIERASRLGAKGLEVPLAKVDDYRLADLKASR